MKEKNMTEVSEVTAVDLQTQVDELRQKLNGFIKQVDEYEKVHVSRRGVQGIAGPKGDTGATGAPADPKEVAAIAAQLVQRAYRFDRANAQFDRLLSDFEAEIKAAKAAIQWAVVEELKVSGVIDSEGNAILKEGLAGKDSQVPGPEGRAGRDGVDGQSIVGPAGRDAKISIGSVTAGDKASATLREENGVQVLDLVLPRGEQGPAGRDGADSTVPGPKGDSIIGPEGLPGLPGHSDGLSKTEVVVLINDMKARGYFRN
jgi:hypothetical protein